MKLDYGTQLSAAPIRLSVGTIKKPKLIDIAKIGFDTFAIYETFLKLTPELYYKVFKQGGAEEWDSMSEEMQYTISLYDVIKQDASLQKTYTEILSFFFAEKVVYSDGLFCLINPEYGKEITMTDIRSVLHDDTFMQTLQIIQQVCCIYADDEEPDQAKFKNKRAKMLYEKMRKAQREQKAKQKADKNLTLPNIISALSNKHPSISPLSVWDMTIFQLMDAFERLQLNTIYDIDSVRVSVWGDENKTFDAARWYRNNYDKQ